MLRSASISESKVSKTTDGSPGEWKVCFLSLFIILLLIDVFFSFSHTLQDHADGNHLISSCLSICS
uniref:Uncharacterized protein n=1 Tax=Rhizophora mucronata TaxID=61149 RepID=A0A2P2MCR8_RHIMU